MEKESKFVGGLLALIGWSILSFLLTVFTFGIAYPWALCFLQAYKTNNTIIEGKRLVFKGSGLSLLGNWIKWWFFTVITFGIYGLWLPIKIEQWKVKNTFFAD